MKNTIILVIVVILLGIGLYMLSNKTKTEPVVETETLKAQIIPITHATSVIQWGDVAIYTDPTGGLEAFAGKKVPQIILVTDIHGDHLSTSTLSAVIASSTLIVPQAVKDLLPANLASTSRVMKNGDKILVQGFSIEAIPMYNLPEATTSRHTKGRGNGYVIEKNNFRVYVAGDTSGTPEMKTLKNIDIALVPMNPPFTMTVEEAADAVLAFKPKVVYPYHYRGQDGLSDINKFKQLVNAGNPNIEVRLENWYPNQ